MTSRYILFLLLGIDALVIIFQASELSISLYEADILYGKFSFLQLITNTSLILFGKNDIALRMPMIIFHLLSVVLLYLISHKYLKRQNDRLWLLLIFILLPGVISSALQLNSAGLLIFSLFLFVYIYENFKIEYSYFLLFIYALIDGGFSYLFLSLLFFSHYIKNNKLFLYSLMLFLLSIYLYGIDMSGLPKGHFLDLLAVYCAVFSPIIFIYIFYVLYKRFFTKEIDILWFVSSVVLLSSLVLSFRQKVQLEHLAPYIMLALPLVAQAFGKSYRARLKVFRKKYKFIFTFSLIFLVLNSFVVLFNKQLYYFLDNPQKHFAYKMYIAKELAYELKNMGVDCLETDDSMTKRLNFYGVSKCNKYILKEHTLNDNKSADVTISYGKNIVYKADVTNINNK